MSLPLDNDQTKQPSRFRSFCWVILGFCHSFSTAILFVLVIVLFFQVQYLAVQVKTENAQITQLEAHLQNQTQGQITALNEKVEQEHSLTLYQMAGTFTLLTCLLTMFHMSSHLRHFYEPIVQRRIVAILWLSPIYAITSFLSLVIPSADGYLAVIKDFYEAYVVYSFLAFLIAVLGRGDRQVAVDVLACHADQMQRPTRCLSGFYYPPPDTSNTAKANAVLTECQILVMQFVFVRPLTSIANFVSTTIMADGDDETLAMEPPSHTAFLKSPSFYFAMVTNISVFLAFTGLLKFYHAVREDLKWCQPLPKFMTIKGIVFLTFWQGLLISIVVSIKHAETTSSTGFHRLLQDTLFNTTMPDNSTGSFSSPSDASTSSPYSSNSDTDTAGEEAARIQNFLICLEMLFFSIAHWCVFPFEEWEPDYRPTPYAKPGLAVKDFVNDLNQLMSGRLEAKRAYQKSAKKLDSNGDNDDVVIEMEDTEDGKIYSAVMINPHRSVGRGNHQRLVMMEHSKSTLDRLDARSEGSDAAAGLDERQTREANISSREQVASSLPELQ